MRRPAYRHVEAEALARRRTRPNAFARIVRLVLQGRLFVILAWVVLAAAGITYSALKASLDLHSSDLVALDPRITDAQHRLESAFPGTGAPIVAVVEASDPKAAREAAADLAATMTNEPRFFSDVFAPGTGRFFDEYGVLYLDAAAVEDIVRRIERSAPLYRAIAASPDLAGLAALSGQTARAITVGRSPQGLDALFAEAALTVKGQIEDRRHDLDWPALVAHGPSLDSTRWYVLAWPVAAKGSADPYRAAVERARVLADEIAGAAKSPVSVTLTGRPVLAEVPPASFAPALALPVLLSSLLVTIILGFGLSRLGPIVTLLLAFVLGLMVFAGAAAAIAPRLDRVTVTAPLIYLGLALPAMIAMMLRAEEHEKAGMTSGTALVLAAHRLGPAFLLGLIAIAGGGLAALATSFTSLRMLAFVTAAAAVIVFLAVLTLLPVLLDFMSASHDEEEDTHWLDLVLDGRAPPAWQKLRQGLVAMLIVAAILCAALVPQMKIEIPGEPVARAGRAAQLFDELAAREPSLRAAAYVLAKPGEEARALAVRLAALPEVQSVTWIESFLPAGEVQKRQILARLDGVLPKLPDQSTETDEGRLRTELSRLEEYLLDIANNPETADDLKRAANEFRRSLALFDGPKPAPTEAIRRLENALFARLPLLFEQVERLSNLPPLEFANLDPDIVRRYVGEDGSWRLEIAPRDTGAFRRFANAVRAVAPGAAGPAIVEVLPPEAMRGGLAYVVAGILALSFLSALVATLSLLGAMRVIVPPALLSLIAAGGLVLDARNLPPETISVVIMAIATTVGAGLIAERWNGRMSAWTRETPATLPRAILLAELLLAAAFAPLMLSSLPAFREFGAFVAIASALQFIAAFLIAPELARWTRRR